MSQLIRKAVIPAAGLGTRFLPATKAIPKEMIPIVDIPMIQLIVEEAARSGINEIVLITARHKEAIENHFDYNAELEEHLERKAKHDLAEISRSVGRNINIISIRQKNPLGLGHAVLCAEPVIGNEPFAVLLGDDLIDAQVPCTLQLMNHFYESRVSVVGIMEVPQMEVSKYGIVAGTHIPGHRSSKLIKVSGLVEKPKPSEAPSCFAIPGRYVLAPSIFAHLKQLKPGAGGELQLTDALHTLALNEGLNALLYDGVRYDTGDRIGFIDATLAYALKRPELKDSVENLLRKYLS